jgi:ribose transport system ATP-binding protein
LSREKVIVASLVRAENITKRFPGVLALDQVSLDLRPGEVHVLFGENGAGKSTVIKILSGAYLPDAGDIYVGGEKVIFRSPHDARVRGISAVYQEFSLVPQLTVAENFFLGRELVTRGLLNTKSMRKMAKVPLEDLGFEIDPMAKVGNLSRAERQMVEIAKAFQQRMSVLILDEPTASVTDKEVSRLFAIIKRLTNDGVGVIYISHRIDELQKIGDRITVLRDGKKVATRDMSDVDKHTLISMMTGKEYEDTFPTITHGVGETVLAVENLSTDSGLHDINFEVRAGEILGIAGLIGGGKSRVGRAIFGLEKITGGQITLFGEVLDNIQPARSLKRGIIYFPADRHKEGLVLCRSVKENQTLASVPLFERRGFLEIKREESVVKNIVTRMGIRTPGIGTMINYLSGGNQQKVLLSRGLNQEVKIFIFDEASCGIDVAAKRDVYVFLKEQAERGAAVIFISSELPEILHLSHTVMVMHLGAIRSVMSGSEATEEKILSSCFGYDHKTLASGAGENAGMREIAAASDD